MACRHDEDEFDNDDAWYCQPGTPGFAECPRKYLTLHLHHGAGRYRKWMTEEHFKFINTWVRMGWLRADEKQTFIEEWKSYWDDDKSWANSSESESELADRETASSDTDSLQMEEEG